MTTQYNRPSFYKRNHGSNNNGKGQPAVSPSRTFSSSTVGSTGMTEGTHIKVKIQSLTAPVGTHRLFLADLENEHGKPCFTLLQDAILTLATSTASCTCSLKLALSYLDQDGDLIPLTSQEEWEHVVNQHTFSHTLLVFAQALPDMDMNINMNWEERFTRLEDILMGNIQDELSTSTPTRRHSPPDYSAIIKDHQASLETRLNKVKQMNSACNSPARPTPVLSQDILQGILQKLNDQDIKLESIQTALMGRAPASFQPPKEEDYSRPSSPFTEASSELVTTVQVLFASIQQRLDDFQEHLLTNRSNNSSAIQNTVMITTNMLQQRLTAMLQEMKDLKMQSTKALENTIMITNNMIHQRLAGMEQKIELSDVRNHITDIKPTSSVDKTIMVTTNMLQQRLVAIQTNIKDLQQEAQLSNNRTVPFNKLQASDSHGQSPRDNFNTKAIQDTIVCTSNMLHARLAGMQQDIKNLQHQESPNTRQSQPATAQTVMLASNLIQQKIDAKINQLEKKLQQDIPHPAAPKVTENLIMITSNMLQARLVGVEKHLQNVSVAISALQHQESLNRRQSQPAATAQTIMLASNIIQQKIDAKINQLEKKLQPAIAGMQHDIKNLQQKQASDSLGQSPRDNLNTKAIQDTIVCTSNMFHARLAGMQQDIKNLQHQESPNRSPSQSAATAQTVMLASNLIQQKIDAKINQLEKKLQQAIPHPAAPKVTENLIMITSNMLHARLAGVEKHLQNVSVAISALPGITGYNSVDSSSSSTSDKVLMLLSNMIQQKITALSTDMHERLDRLDNQIATIPPSSRTHAAGDRLLMVVGNMVQQRISVLSNTLDARLGGLEDRLVKLPGSFDKIMMLVTNMMQQRVSSIKDHMDSLYKTRPPPISSSSDKYVMAVNNLAPKKMGSLQQHQVATNLLPQASANNNSFSSSVSISTSTSSSSTSNPSVAATYDEVGMGQVVMHVDKLLQRRISLLQQHLDGRMDALLTSTQAPSQTSVALPTSPHPPSSSPDVVQERLNKLQETMDASFHHLESRLTKQIQGSQETLLAGYGELIREFAGKIKKMVNSSQAIIVKNEKQYASALRQTMFRLHKETLNHVESVTTSRNRAAVTNGDGAYSELESVKHIIISSHDELYKSQEQIMLNNKNQWIECMELAQSMLLTKFLKSSVSESALDEVISNMEQRLSMHIEQIQAQATAAILDRVEQQAVKSGGLLCLADAEVPNNPAASSDTSRDLSVSGGASTRDGLAVAAVAVEQMESILLAAMEKLELAIESNCEQIQAQAVAVVLDKIENIQGSLASKLESSQGVVLEKIVTSQGLLLKQSDASQKALSSKLDSAYSFLEGMDSRIEEQQEEIHREIKKHQPNQPTLRRNHTATLKRQLTPPTVRPRSPQQLRTPRDHSRREPDLGEFKYSEEMNTSVWARANMQMSAASVSRNATYATDFPDNSQRQRRDSRGGGGGWIIQRFMDIETRSLQLEQAYECIKLNRSVPAHRATPQDEEKTDEILKLGGMAAYSMLDTSANTNLPPYLYSLHH